MTWVQVLGSNFVVLGRRILDGKQVRVLLSVSSVNDRNKAALLLSLTNITRESQ